MDTESNDNEFRRIDTGMYTAKAAVMADLVSQLCRFSHFGHPHQDTDGQVYFHVRTAKTLTFRHGGDAMDNPLYGKSDADALSDFADGLKSLLEMSAIEKSWKDGWWSRKNTRIWRIYDVYGYPRTKLTIADAIKAYNVLKGISKRPDKQVVGRPLTPADIKRMERTKERAKAKSAKELVEWQKTRRIDTGLYGDKAYELLKLLCGHYWFRFIPRGERGLEDFVAVRRAEDNEIYLEVRLGKSRPYTDHRRNPFFGMRRASVLATLGAVVKAFAAGFTKDKYKCKLKRGWWCMSNGGELVGACDYGFSATVSDAYRTAAALMGDRLTDDGRVLGRPLTKKEIKAARDAKAAEDAKATAWHDYVQAANELHFDYIKKLKAAYNRLWKIYVKEIHEIDPAADPMEPFSGGRPVWFSPCTRPDAPCAAE